jgi:hypothetical protein
MKIYFEFSVKRDQFNRHWVPNLLVTTEVTEEDEERGYRLLESVGEVLSSTAAKIDQVTRRPLE